MPRTTRRVFAATVLLVSTAALAPASAISDASRDTVVQPGMRIYQQEDQSVCTVGFLIRDSAGVVYSLEGVYCPPDYSTDNGVQRTRFIGVRRWPAGKGPALVYPQRPHAVVGRAVLQVAPNNTSEPAYSLMRLVPGAAYSARVPVIGGPFRHVYRGETTTPTSVGYVCADAYTASYSVNHTAGYNDGSHRDVAPEGIRHGVFHLAQPVDESCQGAPVVAFDGSYAVGMVNGNATTNPDASMLDGSATPTAPAHRVDALLDDASRRMHTTFTLLQAGVHGRTTK
jgi:hypothetical protein